MKKSSKTAKPAASEEAGERSLSKDDYIRVVPLYYPKQEQPQGDKHMAKAQKIAKPKPATKSERTAAAKHSSGEFIRVAPMHYAKNPMKLGKGKDAGVYEGQPFAAPAAAHLTYFNGPLLSNVEVFTIFWGTSWNSNAGGVLMGKLNAFFAAILVSPLLDQLAEYSVPGKTIGHGSLIGTKVITANAPVGSVTDTTVRAQLPKWIAAKTVPPTTKNTLYFIYLDPGIVSIMGGSKSCQSFCGYHNNIGANVYYSVMPYPTCTGCLGGLSTFDALTGTSSHELCEAITDPIPGSGWYDNVHGEIGDICAWTFKKVAGFRVQLEWSNAKNKCI